MAIHQATRRELLAGSGALFAWAFAPKLARAEGRDPRFLTIVLRGALDGLAAAAPRKIPALDRAPRGVSPAPPQTRGGHWASARSHRPQGRRERD